jgi:3-hydroxy-3-methylglutaryl CoA synthase
VGITSYGGYIPWHRIGRQHFVKVWGGFSLSGERAIAGYDEDSLTMAVEAAMDCLRGLDPQTVDGLFFATTTSPHKEKQCSALIAMPLDLRRDIRTADITTSKGEGSSPSKWTYLRCLRIRGF